jgi:hypothetical protein
VSDEPKPGVEWNNAMAVASNGNYKGITKGALFYHSVDVEPFWAKSFVRKEFRKTWKYWKSHIL